MMTEIASPATDPRCEGSTDLGNDDELLAGRIRCHDGEAFGALFRKYAPITLALARRVLRDPRLAEDVVQEAFLHVWKRADAYDPARGSLRTWLITVTHRRAVDRVRRESTQAGLVDRVAADPILQHPAEDPAVEVVEELSDRARRAAVRRALTALPEEQLEVIRRMYFGGQSGSQIAAELGLPLGTVKSRALLAMRRLRASLPIDLAQERW